jgi:hypothetical protein
MITRTPSHHTLCGRPRAIPRLRHPFAAAHFSQAAWVRPKAVDFTGLGQESALDPPSVPVLGVDKTSSRKRRPRRRAAIVGLPFNVHHSRRRPIDRRFAGPRRCRLGGRDFLRGHERNGGAPLDLADGNEVGLGIISRAIPRHRRLRMMIAPRLAGNQNGSRGAAPRGRLFIWRRPRRRPRSAPRLVCANDSLGRVTRILYSGTV